MELIKSNKRMELIKYNQGMVLVKSNQDIQLWRISMCSIMTDDKTLNRDRQENKIRWVHLGIIFEA